MRGYQRRVIYLKNVESSVFEGAYFIIKPGVEKVNDTEEPDFIKEANRIIEESVGQIKNKKSIRGLKEGIIFASGFLLSTLAFLIFV